jgi:serine protease AprX
MRLLRPGRTTAARQRPIGSRRSLFALFPVALATLVFASPSAGQVGARADQPEAKLSHALAVIASSLPSETRVNVIVEGADATDAADAAAAHGRAGKQLGLIDGVTATVPAGRLLALATDPRVSFVALDAPVEPTGSVVSSTSLVTTYPVRDAAPNPWSAGATGAGIGIAVIDSGVTPSTDFGTRLVQVRLDGQTGSLDDTVGHGTMVAGVAAGYSPDGKFIGIAPGATVYAININRPTGVSSGDVITALKWVFDNAHTYNIRVVNLSLAETVTSSYTESPLDLAVERLWASGVFVAVAAGNQGAGQINYAPANDPLAFTVGAFDTMDSLGPGDDTALSWSASGTTANGFAKPELVAPGRHIAAPLPAGTTFDLLVPLANRIAPGHATINGTSFAAPQVAGAAAIVFGVHPAWSPDNVKWALIAKQGPKPSGSPIGSLSLAASYNVSGTPGRANQGVPALVCAPGVTCQAGATIASKWDSSSWTSSSWTSSSWTAATWNSSSWTAVANWDSSGWTSSGWTSSGWTSSGWTSSPVGFDLWG